MRSFASQITTSYASFSLRIRFNLIRFVCSKLSEISSLQPNHTECSKYMYLKQRYIAHHYVRQAKQIILKKCVCLSMLYSTVTNGYERFTHLLFFLHVISTIALNSNETHTTIFLPFSDGNRTIQKCQINKRFDGISQTVESFDVVHFWVFFSFSLSFSHIAAGCCVDGGIFGIFWPFCALTHYFFCLCQFSLFLIILKHFSTNLRTLSVSNCLERNFGEKTVLMTHFQFNSVWAQFKFHETAKISETIKTFASTDFHAQLAMRHRAMLNFWPNLPT